jgi:hypothetical protein
MAIRGTTPLWVFTFPFDPANFQILYLTVTQGCGTVFEKELSDLTIDSSAMTVSYLLTQEETLSFTAKVPVLIQFRGKDKNGIAWASEILQDDVNRVLKDGVI